MKSIIIYRSKTGFTERYAQWLAERLSCRAVPYSERNRVDLNEYDTIIYGGSFRAGAIGGVKWFKEQAEKYKTANKVVLGVGAMPDGLPAVTQAIDQNFTEEEQNEIKVFYLQGGLSYEKMGFMDRQLMKMFGRMLAKRKDATEEEQETAKAVAGSYDAADRAYLEPVVAYVRSLE